MKELTKQLIFDCAMELIYHYENMTDEEIANRLLDIIHMEDEAIKHKLINKS